MQVMLKFLLSGIVFGLLLAIAVPAFGQFQIGGVDHKGEWFVGENLKQGDYFSYNLCHVDYKECSEFGMDFWIEGEIAVGSEQKWNVETIVFDGNKVIPGNMELGKLIPEPTGSSKEILQHANAFKSSIVWLSACATQLEPKEFSAPSWCKIANIGGEQIMPTEIETITIPSGTWETVVISWKTGGYASKVWVSDEFPFPVKASTWIHTNTGIPPQEYKFELLDYKQNVMENPFVPLIPPESKPVECPEQNEFTSIKKLTENYLYLLEVRHTTNPFIECEMKWQINFKNKVNPMEFLNQVQYDILVLDELDQIKRTISQENGKRVLYSPSGLAELEVTVKEKDRAKYVIYVYGLEPLHVVPSPDQLDVLVVEIPIAENLAEHSTQLLVPSWIKQNAAWWADGSIDDDSFIQGIQFLIKEGMMEIPPTAQGTGSSNDIPSWIKQNAAWWADGSIDDDSFIQGIQFLIKEGIMNISTLLGNE